MQNAVGAVLRLQEQSGVYPARSRCCQCGLNRHFNTDLLCCAHVCFLLLTTDNTPSTKAQEDRQYLAYTAAVIYVTAVEVERWRAAVAV
jgi:hypothetical protein